MDRMKNGEPLTSRGNLAALAVWISIPFLEMLAQLLTR